MDLTFDTGKSLLQLEPDLAEDAAMNEEQALVLHRVGMKPLRRFHAGDLYQCLRRHLGVAYCAPLTVDALEDDPFLQAADYPGDLLVALLETDSRYWIDHYEVWIAVIELLGKAVTLMNERIQQEERDAYLPWHLGDDFMAAVIHFQGIHTIRED